ncbi:MAG: hypothetical protein WAV25_01360 [Minisyncoccia bacterium]
MKNQKGIIGLIILVIIALILLKYFLDWSIFEAADSAQGQETIGYTQTLFNTIWSYIGAPVTFIWTKIFMPILQLTWDNFLAFLSWGKQVGGN